MKIKRYMAASMRAALDQVRIEQGPDAVILSSRRVNEGIEVIAAVDYDEALIAGAARRYSLAMAALAPAEPPPGQAAAAAPPRALRAPPPTPPAARPEARAPAAASSRPAAARPAAAGRTAPAAVPVVPAGAVRCGARAPAPQAAAAQRAAAPAAAAPAAAALGGRAASDDARRGFAGVEREIKDLRRLLESELAHISWHDKRACEPLKTRVIEELSSMGIAPDVAAALAALTPARTNLEDPSSIPLALLLKHLPVVEHLSTAARGVFAVVGPTGAGKTTTIAKLAARWTTRYGSEDLALVSMDAYRIGAREQLMTYARILGASMHAPNSGQELARVLAGLKSKKLVLIDTAGMAPRDVRLNEQLSALKSGAPRAKFLLALPAQGEGRSLEEILRAFAPISPVACILTKLDEAGSLGAVISTTLRHKLKIAYLCNGQRVPEDLHSAHQRRVWLVRAARDLKEPAPQRRDDAYYARNFGRAAAHA
ncbi:MAG TPA: flagellar biosynthesis protein FlhF [Steroidobacteraceae bacterium]|nr:flagellar biosynthesis protein FlhF [Steroidobacteraceae bacterium]